MKMGRLRVPTAVLLVVLLWTRLEVESCTVDGGNFTQIIQLEEELPIGSTVGTLHLDNPSEVKSLQVNGANAYIELVTRKESSRTSYSFVISKRIDMDTGLSRLQLMFVDCLKLDGLKLQIEVEFMISDINDHKPIFQPSAMYNFSIAENASPRTQVGIVKARDDDIKNTYIHYQLVQLDPPPSSVQNPFALTSLANGAASISLTSSIDYEVQRYYKMLVIAKDCQTRRNCVHRQKTSTATVTVHVENKDDLDPEFDQTSYQVSLSQDAKEDDLVTQVTAIDKDDLDDPIQYSLSGTGNEHFIIDPVTGKVIVRNVEGLQAGERYNLRVQATQRSDPSKADVAALIVTIVTADWDKPTFTERSYITSLTEYSRVNASVLSMAINYNLQPFTWGLFAPRHNKLRKRAPLTVKMEAGIVDGHFRIEHLGNNVDLILTKMVDYEQQKVHRVAIVASNGQYTDRVQVTINVLNENDNSPDFDQSTYSFARIYSKQGIVGKVTATDIDNPNEVITYQFLPSDFSYMFSINSTGHIAFTENLHHYTKESYTLVVEASDSGNPKRSANVVVTVTIIDPVPAGISMEDEQPNKEMTLYIVAGSATVVLAVFAGVAAYCVSRKIQARNLRKRANMKNRNGQVIDDPAFSPLCRDRQRDTSSLGLMSVVNGRHENTYRNMSDLSYDDKYQTMWRSRSSNNGSLMERSESKALLNQRVLEQEEACTSSDSGCSSRMQSMSPHLHHSQCDSEATTASHSQYREGHRAMVPAALDNGFLVEAPAEFRGSHRSRQSSIAESVHSDYAESNTSDYGSNTGPSEPNYKTAPISPREDNSAEQATDVITITKINSHKPSANDSLTESATKKPFSTFHGELA